MPTRATFSQADSSRIDPPATLNFPDVVAQWLSDATFESMAGPIVRGDHAASPDTHPELRPLSDDCVGVHPFSRFGHWGNQVHVVRPGYGLPLIRWLALHRDLAKDRHSWWNACRNANPHCFQTFQIVRLERPSFFLPAGECVFEVIANPSQIPDNPPHGVLLRHWEAMISHPDANFYFLRPVFTWDDEFRLLLPAELREEAALDRENALFAVRLYGHAIRTSAWILARARSVARIARARLAQGVSAISHWFQPTAKRRAAQALRNVDASRLPSGIQVALAREFASGATSDLDAFRRAMKQLSDHVAVDPILCFELDHRPGELWFEAHWYEGQNGRRYVHY